MPSQGAMLRVAAQPMGWQPYAFTTGPSSGSTTEVAAMQAKQAEADTTVWGVDASLLKASQTCDHKNPVLLDPQQQHFSDTLGDGLVCDKIGNMKKYACIPRKDMLLPGKVDAPSFSRTVEQCVTKCDPDRGQISGSSVVPQDDQLCITKVAGIDPLKYRAIISDISDVNISYAPYPPVAAAVAPDLSSYIDNQGFYPLDRGNWGWQLSDTIELTDRAKSQQ